MTGPKVIGHRGVRGHAPENTLAAMRKAAQLGVRWVEFDVRLSLDAEIVVIHDEKLKRTTNGLGLVAETELAALQALDAGSWFSEEFKGETIPTLGQLVDELARLGLGANVEIKRGAKATALFLERHWPDSLPPPLISSFHEDALITAAKVAPNIPRALCIDKIPKDWRPRLESLGCSALHCRGDKLKPEQADSLKDRGFALRCYTVNDPSQAQTLFDWGVNAVFSDFPERINAV